MSEPPSVLQPTLDPKAEMGFLDHLAELRTRLIISFLAIFLLSIASYFFTSSIISWLSAPYHEGFKNHLLIGTGPAEAFLLRLKVCIFSGLITASPIIFYQLWLFIAPGLYLKERRLVFPFIISTTSLFLLGGLFCYYAVFPFALKFFFEQYQSISITPTIRLSEYLSMIMSTLFGFGLVFEMPVLAYFLGRVGIIDDQMLKKFFRYAVVIIFIVAAVMTPPDVISQLLMAAPLLMLYGLSILVVKWTGKRKDEDGE